MNDRRSNSLNMKKRLFVFKYGFFKAFLLTGMWYTKTDYEKSQYYCIKMEEVTPRAVKLGYKGSVW